MSFIEELKRRNVFRVAVAYIVLGWIVVQATDTVAPALNLPDWTLALVTWLGIIAFPFVLLLSWAFELTPDGLKLEKHVTPDESVTRLTGRKLDFVIIGFLSIALFFVMIDQYVLEDSPVEEKVSSLAEQTPGPPPIDRGEKSIAVLPFVNMSDEKDYFADGLTEEILNLLARNKNLKVTGRTSSFAFKGENRDLRDIGAALNVNTVLEGSVRKSKSRLRVTAQLIDVKSGYHIWSDTYDRETADVFAMQDDIAGAILKALEIHLGDTTPSRGRPTENMLAYENFLAGRALLATGLEYSKARDFLVEAVELDPGFAEAWQELSIAYWFLGGLTSEVAVKMVNETAGRALAIDPGLSIAAAMEASSNTEDYSWLREMEYLETAVDEHPEHMGILLALAFTYLEAGYFTELLALVERGVRLDPLSAEAHTRLGDALRSLGRPEEARNAWLRAAELNHALAFMPLFVDYFLAGEYGEALASAEKMYQLSGADSSHLAALFEACLVAETRDAAVERWATEVSTQFSNWFVPWWLYLAFDKQDTLFKLIAESFATGSIWVDADVTIALSGAFRDTGFMANPRYVALMDTGGGVAMWEARGAPDFCSRETGKWECR